jgi:hypothetical protein
VDYAAGKQEAIFFLQNGGFFDEQVPLDTDFTITTNNDQPPPINFDDLP